MSSPKLTSTSPDIIEGENPIEPKLYGQKYSLSKDVSDKVFMMLRDKKTFYVLGEPKYISNNEKYVLCKPYFKSRFDWHASNFIVIDTNGRLNYMRFDKCIDVFEESDIDESKRIADAGLLKTYSSKYARNY